MNSADEFDFREQVMREQEELARILGRKSHGERKE